MCIYIYIYIYIYQTCYLGYTWWCFFGTDQEALRWRPKASSWLHTSVSPSQRKRLAWNGCRNNLHQLLGPWKLGDGLCLKTQQPIPKLGWSLGLGIPVQMFFFVVDRSKMQLLVNHVVCQTGPNHFFPSKQCCLDGSWAIFKKLGFKQIILFHQNFENLGTWPRTTLHSLCISKQWPWEIGRWHMGTSMWDEDTLYPRFQGAKMCISFQATSGIICEVFWRTWTWDTAGCM